MKHLVGGERITTETEPIFQDYSRAAVWNISLITDFVKEIVE
jgi:hypothetical protein